LDPAFQARNRLRDSFSSTNAHGILSAPREAIVTHRESRARHQPRHGTPRVKERPRRTPKFTVDRALTLLLEKVEKQKRGRPTKRATPAKPARGRYIRPGADNSRNIPLEVQRGVCERDGDQCAFVSKDGHRCTERTFLEFHHIVPYALGGRATVDNISLRCRRHNQHEAELVFGPHGASVVREPRRAAWGRLRLMCCSPARSDDLRLGNAEGRFGLRPSAAIPRRGASGAP